MFCCTASAQTRAPDAAQGYPGRPIRMVVAFAPGGGTDIMARLVAQKLAERWGQSVVVDNRAGASGNIGTDIVAKSAPDGHTLLMAFGSHASNAALYSNLPYDPIKDFSAITLVASAPLVITAHPSLPAKHLAELFQLARSKPGGLSYGSSGPGTPVHLAGELLKMLAGIDMVHVPYKGIAPVMTAILSGEVQITYAAVLSGMQHYKTGRLRPLAVASAQRYPSLPDVPTAAESGLKGFETEFWYALLGPARMPRAIVDKIQGEVSAIVNAPQMRDNLLNQGSVPVAGTPEQLAALIKTELERWTKVVKAAGIKAE